jgi:hypothetical protein
MLLFKRKNNKLQLRCYPLNPHLVEYFPIEHSKKLQPKWFKEIPPYKEVGAPTRMPTTKMCPGLQHLFTAGITIPLWYDHVIERLENGTVKGVKCPANTRTHETHNPDQWTGAFPGWTHLKLLSPWFIVADRPVPFMAIAPTWHQENPGEYIIAPGMLEFKYQHGSHIQMFLPPATDNRASEIKLEAGTPMLHLIPTEDVEIELKIEEMNDHIYKKHVEKFNWTFENLYRRSRSVLEKK